MASSAFRSTSKRGTFAGFSDKKDCQHEDVTERIQQGRRSRSVNPVSRQTVESSAGSSYLKRDNPLFNSPSLPPTDLGGFTEGAKSDDRVSDGRRGRPVSRGAGWSSGGGNSSSTRQGIGRSLSRVDTGRKRRSVSRGPSGKSEREREKEHVRTLASTMRNKPTAGVYQSSSDGSYGLYSSRQTKSSPSEAAWCHASNVVGSAAELMENENHPSFYSETEERRIGSACERKEALQRMNRAYMSDADASDHPLESIRPDAIELIYDVRREYALQLEQSEERVRRLQADLDVEEQRRQELSKMLFNVLPDPKASNTYRLKHKASIERKEMSRRLTEEAFSYFDECVSISTFDGSDFSSFDDPVSSSVHTQVGSHPANEDSRASDIEIPITPSEKHRELHNQSPCSLGSGDSNLSTANSFSSSHQHQVPSCTLSPRNGKFQLSLVGEEMQQLIKKFERGKSECDEQVTRSGVNCAPFECSNVQMLAEMVLYDRVALQREIDFGGLLLCDFKVI